VVQPVTVSVDADFIVEEDGDFVLVAGTLLLLLLFPFPLSDHFRSF
jgi:hypothetical protein